MQDIRLCLGLLIVGLALNTDRCDAADWFSSFEPSCSVQSPGCQGNADRGSGGSFVERLFNFRPWTASDMVPGQRGVGLPVGRRYFGGRYFGQFNNRYYGPQYGNF